MFRVLRLTPGDPLLAQERDLRDRALLNPIGYDVAKFEAEFPYFESKAERFVAVMDREGVAMPGARGSGDAAHRQTIVIGCAALLPDHPSAGSGKLMQMAVDKQLRGAGVGRRLVVEIERRAFGELGLTTLYCHARAGAWGGKTDGDAVGFYEACGWEVEGEAFEEAGIPHRKLVVRA